MKKVVTALVLMAAFVAALVLLVGTSDFYIKRVAPLVISQKGSDGSRTDHHGMQAIIGVLGWASAEDMTNYAEKVFEERLRITVDSDARFEFAFVIFPMTVSTVGNQATTQLYTVSFIRTGTGWRREVAPEIKK